LDVEKALVRHHSFSKRPKSMSPAHLLSFCAALLLTGILHAQAPIPIQTALAQKSIRLRMETQTGSRGLTLHIERVGNSALRLVIPAGMLFLPSDTAAQTLINVKEEVFTLNQKKTFIQLKSYCSEAGDMSPSPEDTFQMGNLATGALLKMAEYISKNALYEHQEAQEAIWCITDQHSPASLSHKGLLTTACQLLNTPLPEYKVKTAPIVEVPRRPVQPPTPMEIEGVFTYEAKDSCVLSLAVFNDKNEKVKVFYENMAYPPSKIKYKFSWKTTKMPRGTYEVRLLDRDRLLKKMVVRY
jgi:hypothetical protein